MNHKFITLESVLPVPSVLRPVIFSAPASGVFASSEDVRVLLGNFVADAVSEFYSEREAFSR